ncbi:unnamed protein product [Phytophthora fragariaefolia]|uniref:Unnamed protein product n=1 Tax=Phytophthora fragariaefolia TaxID=1490495 RepID=A0A9W6XMW4_9STRA|nr:unnamed protein product [Phytophthora fragariaefolia]
MTFFIGTIGYTAERPHTCRQFDAAGSSLLDVTGLMKDKADILAIDQIALPARRIWEAPRNQLYGANNDHVVRGLYEAQVLRSVYRARSRHSSGDVHGAIEIPPLALALNEAVSFFQFHYVTINRKNLNKHTRLIGWAHPQWNYVFCWWYFRWVPPGYKQCVIFMVHDRAPGLVDPVYYVFSTSRRDSFWDMVHFVVQGTDQRLEPAEVMCDF